MNGLLYLLHDLIFILPNFMADMKTSIHLNGYNFTQTSTHKQSLFQSSFVIRLIMLGLQIFNYIVTVARFGVF